MYIIGQALWKLSGVSYIVSKRDERWSKNGLKLDRSLYTHPPLILYSTLLAGFVHGGQQTELNQTLPNGTK